MLKGLKKLSQASALAITAIGISSTSDQANAAIIDIDAGTITVEDGDNLTDVAKVVSEVLGSKITYQDIQKANKDLIPDADVIRPGHVYQIPGFSNENEELAGVTEPALTAPTPVAATTPVVQNPINYFDADLERPVLEATEKFSLAFPDKTDEQVLYMAMGYREAIKFANANGEECDTELGDMKPDDIKKFLSSIYSNAMPNQINEMAQGFRIGASAAVANDVLKDALPYWVEETKREHAGLADDIINIIAQESLEAYLDGKACVGAGCEAQETVAVTPVVETPSSYTIQPGDGLTTAAIALGVKCGDLAKEYNVQYPDFIVHPGQVFEAGNLERVTTAHESDNCPVPARSEPVNTADSSTNVSVGVTPNSSVITVTEYCQIVREGDRLFSIPTSEEFNKMCGCANTTFGNTIYKLTLEDGRVVKRGVWGNPGNICETGGDAPVVTPEPPVVPPDDGGGCEAKGNCHTDPVKPDPTPDPELPKCDPVDTDVGTGNQPGIDAGAGSGDEPSEQPASPTDQKHTAVYPSWDKVPGARKALSFGIA